MNTRLPVSVLLLLLFSSAGFAQFALRFDDSFLSGNPYEEVYPLHNGAVMMVLDVPTPRLHDYIFFDGATGELLSAFSLEIDYRSLLGPDGVLYATSEEGTIRQLARYDAATLAPLDAIAVDVLDSPLTGFSGFPASTGGWVIGGIDSPNQLSVVAKVGADMTEQWATGLSFQGQPNFTGVEVYPLANGDVGFYAFYQVLENNAFAIKEAFGLLDGTTGELRYSVVFTPALNQFSSAAEVARLTFGSDGSAFAHLQFANPLVPPSNSAKLIRVNPDGTLAYSRTITIPGGVPQWQYYFDGYALVAFETNNASDTQFVVLAPDGSVTVNAALSGALTGGGNIEFRAVRREGTNIAFVEMELSSGVVLMRLDLATADVQLRSLPTDVLEGIFQPVTTPASQFQQVRVRSFPAVSTTMAVSYLTAIAGRTVNGLVELPADGSWPSCVPLGTSSVNVIQAIELQITDEEHAVLEGWTASGYGSTGPWAAVTPSVPMGPRTIEVTYDCDDDGGPTLWTELDDLGGGWFFSAWFGIFNRQFDPWINHDEHGFLFANPAQSADAAYFYDLVLGWLFTRDDVYPEMYAFGLGEGTWVSYAKGTKSPRQFYRYDTGEWVEVARSGG